MSSATQSRRHVNLTKTEVFIVRAIVAGHTSTKDLQIAYDFNQGTLSSHLRNIYKKTGAYNKADLVLMALGRKQGSIDVEKQIARFHRSMSL